MTHAEKSHACLTALWAFVALALTPTIQAQVTNPTVSYLYVAGPKVIYAYNIAADGSLSAMKGAPFAGILSTFLTPVANGTLMYAMEGNTGQYDNIMVAFKIESNGVLKQVNSTDMGTIGPDCTPIDMFLDKKGETLYTTSWEFGQEICSFKVNWDTGALTLLGEVEGLPGSPGTTDYFYYPPKFLGNDKYLYAGNNQQIMGWTRTSNGSLAAGPSTPVLPLAPPGYVASVGEIAAADPTDHMAFTFTFHQGDPSGSVWGPEQLGVYTADALGNLITTSTYLNMPTDAVGGYDYNIQFSPSGKLIAVSGPAGLQLFHFSSGTITPYTALVSTGSFAYFRWDNSNHLLGFDSNTGKLHIFNATPTSVTEAPGSPHSMPFDVPFNFAGYTVQNAK
jgi:hypothetical protein